MAVAVCSILLTSVPSSTMFCHAPPAALQFRQVKGRCQHAGSNRSIGTTRAMSPTKRKAWVVCGKEERWQTSGKQGRACAAHAERVTPKPQQRQSAEERHRF